MTDYPPRSINGVKVPLSDEEISEIQENEPSPIDIAKVQQREIIKQAYCAAECESIDINVTGINYTFPGGYAAAQIRDDALSLLIRAKARGWLPEEEKVVFYDVNDTPVPLTEDEAEQVVLRTALKFEADHTKDKVRQKSIDEAVTVEEVQAIVWT